MREASSNQNVGEKTPLTAVPIIFLDVGRNDAAAAKVATHLIRTGKNLRASAKARKEWQNSFRAFA